MSKTNKTVVVNGEIHLLDNVNLHIPGPALAKLLDDERKAAQKEVIAKLRPFINGSIGRERLTDFELSFKEEIFPDDFVLEEPEMMIANGGGTQCIPIEDFSQLRQTIMRKV
jgi:hypothetical protein